MSLQKYRADKAGETYPNGGTPWYTHWMGGPSLALVRNCKVENRAISPRTVYIAGEADSWFSTPAVCTYHGKTVKGYVTGSEDNNGGFDGMVFRAMDGQIEERRI